MEKKINLDSLPIELIWNILIFLDPITILRIAQTNKRLLSIATDSAWWRNYLKHNTSGFCQYKSWNLVHSSSIAFEESSAEKEILKKILGERYSAAKYPEGLKTFLEHIKERDQDSSSRYHLFINHISRILKRLLENYKKAMQLLPCVNEGVTNKNYKFLFLIQQLEEDFTFLSCANLLREESLSKAAEIIIDLGADKTLTRECLLSLNCYTKKALIRFLLESSTPSFLKLLAKLGTEDWKVYIKDENLFNSYALTKAITNNFFMPKLDTPTISTLINNSPDALIPILSSSQVSSHLSDEEIDKILKRFPVITADIKECLEKRLKKSTGNKNESLKFDFFKENLSKTKMVSEIVSPPNAHPLPCLLT